MPFLTVLELYEMLTASSRIRTRFADSISYDDNLYTMSVSFCACVCVYVCVCVRACACVFEIFDEKTDFWRKKKKNTENLF